MVIRYYNVIITDEKSNSPLFRWKALVSKKQQNSGRFSFKKDVIENLITKAFVLERYNEKTKLYEVISKKNEERLHNFEENKGDRVLIREESIQLRKGTYLLDSVGEDIKSYENFDIPKIILKYLPSEEKFIKYLEDSVAELNVDCYDEEPEINRASVENITEICLELINKTRTIERSITSEDYLSFIDDLKRGNNGIGLSWSWNGGRAIEGSSKDRYMIDIVAEIVSPSTIDYFSTYIHDQVDYEMKIDEEIRLNEGGKIRILRLNILDRKMNKDYKYDYKNREFIVEVNDYY